MDRSVNFSVVITTRNRRDLLRRAAESVLKQTYPCQVVVVDDNSADGTSQLIAELRAAASRAGRSFISHRNSTQLGHPATMNVGVALARGEWIKPLDDDDYLVPNCLDEMARLIHKHPRAVICSCRAFRVDASGNQIGLTKASGPYEAFSVPQDDIHYGMLLDLLPFGSPTQVAFRRDAFVESGQWNAEYAACQEVDSWIRIACSGDAIFTNKPLAYRAIWPGSNYKRLPVTIRMQANLLVKESLIPLVNASHPAPMPSAASIRKFVRIHWGVVAFKERKFATAITIGLRAAFSVAAWRLVIRAANFSRQRWPDDQVRRRPLVGAPVGSLAQAVGE